MYFPNFYTYDLHLQSYGDYVLMLIMSGNILLRNRERLQNLG